MALYMTWEGLTKIDGSATIEKLSDEIKGSPMRFDSFEFEFSRPIEIAVGDAGNATTGQVEMSNLRVSRQMDGASPYLQTFFYRPRGIASIWTFNLTQTAADGVGESVAASVILEGGRMTSYTVDVDNDERVESISFAYTAIDMKRYNEDEMGFLLDPQSVKFNVALATLQSKTDWG